MSRLIDADELYDDILYDSDYDNDTINHFIDMVSAQPNIDAEPVRHGMWIMSSHGPYCSKCGTEPEGIPSPYCPHCGAKMDE